MTQDVIIVGSGQAGVPLAVRLAALGKHVLLIEGAELGGTCVNRGCTPTKTMIASARAAHVARHAARLGVHTGPVRVALPEIVARKNRIVQQWRQRVERHLASAEDRLQIVRGWAAFAGPHVLRVAGREYSAETIVVNTGGRTVIPPLAGLDHVRFLDSTSILDLEEVPRHLVILGGGYVAVEFAQMFRRFGAAVTIVERGAHLLGREDADVVDSLESAFRAEDIALELGARAARVRAVADGTALDLEDGRTIEGSHLLVAVGRQPATRELGCEAAGITLDARGAIVVDDEFRTSAAGVFAVGDVLGGPQFTHNAWDDHRLLYDVLQGRSRSRSKRLVPYCVFTDPQLARVGLSEGEAKSRGVAYETASLPFAQIARATELDEPAGILKVLLDPATEQILGAAIVGIEAGELIHVFVALMQAKAKARTLVDAQAIHPTLAEGLQSVVSALPRYAT